MTYLNYLIAEFKQSIFILPALVLLILVMYLLNKNYTLYVSIPELLLIVIIGNFIRAFIEYRLKENNTSL